MSVPDDINVSASDDTKVLAVREWIMTKAAEVLGVPYPIDSYYMPLVQPADVAEKGLDSIPLFDVSTVFDMGWIKKFCDIISKNIDPAVPPYSEVQALCLGLGFGEIEGYLYHAIIKGYQPKVIVEIGAGVSTWYAWHASRGMDCRIICIEPYPTPQFEEWTKNNGITLCKVTCQQALQDNLIPFEEHSIIFIDSTHVVKVTSELPDIFFKLLDKVKSQSLVHFHDIYVPYPTLHANHNMFDSCVNWSESLFLSLFIKLTQDYKVVFPQYWLGRNHQKLLEKTHTYYAQKHTEGSSFWMERI